MESTNFEFLRPENEVLANLGGLAEAVLHIDPGSALTRLRSFAEELTKAIYREELLQAGCDVENPESAGQEVEVNFPNNPTGKGYVDYVLWGNNGQPLAVVEAKKSTRVSPSPMMNSKPSPPAYSPPTPAFAWICSTNSMAAPPNNCTSPCVKSSA